MWFHTPGPFSLPRGNVTSSKLGRPILGVHQLRVNRGEHGILGLGSFCEILQFVRMLLEEVGSQTRLENNYPVTTNEPE